MQTREEVMITTGVNNEALDSGLMTAKQKVMAWAESVGQKINSTVSNPNRFKSDAEKYVGFWKKALKEKDDAERNSSVEEASRSNQARKLIRQRHAAAENKAAMLEELKREADIESASRSNQARKLMRIREERALKRMQGIDEAAMRADIAQQDKIAHYDRVTRIKKEEATQVGALQRIGQLMKFVRAGLMIGGILNAPKIIDASMDSLKEFGSRMADFYKVIKGFSVGGLQGAQNELSGGPFAFIDKLKALQERIRNGYHEANKKRWDEEKRLADLEAERLAMVERRKALEKADAEERDQDLPLAERLAKLQKEDSALLEKMHEIKKEGVEIEELRIERASKLKSIAQLHRDIEKEKTDEARKQSDLAKAIADKKAAAVRSARDSVQGDRQQSTIEELAGAWGNGSQWQDEAQRIQQLAEWEKYNRSGFRDSNVALADKQQRERLSLIGDLTRNNVVAKNPVVEAIDNLKKDGMTVKVEELQGED